jgi:hypothetical protein
LNQQGLESGKGARAHFLLQDRPKYPAYFYRFIQGLQISLAGEVVSVRSGGR